MISDDATREALSKGMPNQVHPFPPVFIEDVDHHLGKVMKCGTHGHRVGRVQCVSIEAGGVKCCHKAIEVGRPATERRKQHNRQRHTLRVAPLQPTTALRRDAEARSVD